MFLLQEYSLQNRQYLIFVSSIQIDEFEYQANRCHSFSKCGKRQNFKESSLPRCYRLLCLHREVQRARLPSTLAQLSVLPASKSHIHLRNTPCVRFNHWTDQGVPSTVIYPGFQGLHNRQHVCSNSHQNVALSIMVKVCHQEKREIFALWRSAASST